MNKPLCYKALIPILIIQNIANIPTLQIIWESPEYRTNPQSSLQDQVSWIKATFWFFFSIINWNFKQMSPENPQYFSFKIYVMLPGCISSIFPQFCCGRYSQTKKMWWFCRKEERDQFFFRGWGGLISAFFLGMGGIDQFGTFCGEK